MNFEITQEIDLEAELKSLVIAKVSNRVKSFLSGRDYGADIQNVFIGCICVMPRPGYEKWFKVRRPKYNAVEKIKLPDGIEKELKGVFGYDIKLDFEKFVHSTDEEARIILTKEILESLSFFDNLPKKVEKFNVLQFKSDLKAFLRDELMEAKA